MVVINCYDFFFLLIEIYLFSSFSVLIIWSVLFFRFTTGLILKQLFVLVGLLVFFATVMLMCLVLVDFTLFCDSYISTKMIVLLKICLMSVFFFVIMLCFLESVFQKLFFTDLLICLGFILISCFCLFSANDFLLFYVSIELQSILLYLFVAFNRFSNFSSEAGLKYVMLGSFASGLMVFGFSVFYAITASINFFDFHYFFFEFTFLDSFFWVSCYSIGLVLTGIFFKLAVAPFHIWAPDVFEGSNYSTVLCLNTAPKLVLLCVFVQLFFCIFLDFFFVWSKMFLIFGFLSFVWGTVAASYQSNLKRFYAYSSTGIMGINFMIFAAGSLNTYLDVLVNFLIYLLITLNWFALLLVLKLSAIFDYMKYVEDLSLLWKRDNFFLSFVSIMVLFSFLGLPPLLGFLGKFFLYFNLYNSGSSFYCFYCTLMMSGVSAFYYMSCMSFVFFDVCYFFVLWSKINFWFMFFIFCFCSWLMLAMLYVWVYVGIQISLIL